MVETLRQRVTNKKGVTWVRIHATDTEFSALCSDINDETEGVTVSEGEITCPDCIEIVKRCKCDENSCCPACLEHISNQYILNFIKRKVAIGILEKIK